MAGSAFPYNHRTNVAVNPGLLFLPEKFQSPCGRRRIGAVHDRAHDSRPVHACLTNWADIVGGYSADRHYRKTEADAGVRTPTTSDEE